MIVETERGTNGHWITEIPEFPGVRAYGNTCEEAILKAKSLVLRVMADRLEHGKDIPELDNVSGMTP